MFSKILTVSYVLGLNYDLVDLTEEDKKLYTEWLKFREEKDFKKADEIRDILQKKNII